MTPIDAFVLIFGVFLGICGASYTFFGDTYFFILAEQASIGMASAYGLYITLTRLQSYYNTFAAGSWLLIIPFFVGALSFARLTKYRWSARYYTSMLAGLGIGVAFGATIRAEILAGIQMTISDIIRRQPDVISSWLVFVGMICTITYYMYSVKLSASFHAVRGRLRPVMRLGRIFMMACFGYLYSSIFIDESIDLIGSGVVILLRRTIQSILTG